MTAPVNVPVASPSDFDDGDGNVYGHGHVWGSQALDMELVSREIIVKSTDINP